MALIPLTRGEVAIVDDTDAAFLNQWKWSLSDSGKGYYAYRQDVRGGRQIQVFMHRLLTGAHGSREPIVDHKNGNGLDNRRENLRICNAFQNAWNMRKHRGTSRFKGVCFDKHKRRWAAAIKCYGVQHHLGRFKSEESAALAYDEAARKLHGAFARLNFPAPHEMGCL